MKRIKIPDKERADLLEKVVTTIFGINAKVDTSKFEWETDRVEIKDIDFSEDLITILNRLRNSFWVDIEVDIVQEEEVPKEDLKKLAKGELTLKEILQGRIYPVISIELIKKEYE